MSGGDGSCSGDRHGDVVEAVHSAVLGTGLPVGAARYRTVVDAVRIRLPLAPTAAVDDVARRVLARVDGLGALEPLLADPEVTDVLVNGGGRVFVERAGRLRPVELRLDEATVIHLIQRVLLPLGLRADRRAPLVDARLPDGSRVNAVLPPLAVDGPCLAIRRFGARTVPVDEWGPAPVTELLERLVAERRNVLVTGGTGTGKTTLLNTLAGLVPDHERIITIEDAAELRLEHDHVVRLEARPSNAEGVGAVTIRALLRNALRMRPDRLVIGEVRGPEAADLVQGLNTGHDGSLATLHSNGPADALRRLHALVLSAGDAGDPGSVAEQIHSAVDAVVHVRRAGSGRRTVMAVDEVVLPGESDDGRITRALLVDGTARPPSRPARSVEAPIGGGR